MPRVAYVLSRSFTPEYEAVSRQIAALEGGRRHLVLGLLPLRSHPLRLRRKGLAWDGHPLALRALGRFRALRRAELLHVFSPLPLPRRLRGLTVGPPVHRVLTVVSLDPDFERPETLDGFARVLVECEPDRERLLRAGVDPAKLLHVDPCGGGLDERPAPPRPEGPFTLLFASWPFEPDEVHARGLDLLAQALRERPDLRLVVLRRPGSRVPGSIVDWPSNVELREGVVADRETLWAGVHAGVAPFRPAAKSKSVPNSVVEGMLLGRPAIVGAGVGLAPFLVEHGAGAVFDGGVPELLEALDRVRAQGETMALRAQRAARERFGDARYRARQQEIYEELLGRSRPQSRGVAASE